MLSGGDTGDRLAEVNEVLGCLVVQTVEHHEAELERDPLRYIEPEEEDREREGGLEREKIREGKATLGHPHRIHCTCVILVLGGTVPWYRNTTNTAVLPYGACQQIVISAKIVVR